jgi:hypothetical protein
MGNGDVNVWEVEAWVVVDEGHKEGDGNIKGIIPQISARSRM